MSRNLTNALMLIAATVVGGGSSDALAGGFARYARPVVAHSQAAPRVPAGSTLTLPGNFLGVQPGAALLVFQNIKLPLQILKWSDGAVTIKLPPMAIKRPLSVRMDIVQPNGNLALQRKILIVAPPAVILHETTQTSPLPTGPIAFPAAGPSAIPAGPAVPAAPLAGPAAPAAIPGAPASAPVAGPQFGFGGPGQGQLPSGPVRVQPLPNLNPAPAEPSPPKIKIHAPGQGQQQSPLPLGPARPGGPIQLNQPPLPRLPGGASPQAQPAKPQAAPERDEQQEERAPVLLTPPAEPGDAEQEAPRELTDAELGLKILAGDVESVIEAIGERMAENGDLPQDEDAVEQTLRELGVLKE